MFIKNIVVPQAKLNTESLVTKELYKYNSELYNIMEEWEKSLK